MTLSNSFNAIWKCFKNKVKGIENEERNKVVDYRVVFHNNRNTNSNTQILSFLGTVVFSSLVLYGRNSIKGKDAVYSILKTFNRLEDQELRKKLEYTINFLYKGGLLLHSIYEPFDIAIITMGAKICKKLLYKKRQ